MTVISLTPLQKKNIVYMYETMGKPASYLAGAYNTSTRTIGRVLVEAGIDTSSNKKEQRITKMLESFKVTPELLYKILSDHAEHYLINAPIPTNKQIALFEKPPYGETQ